MPTVLCVTCGLVNKKLRDKPQENAALWANEHPVKSTVRVQCTVSCDSGRWWVGWLPAAGVCFRGETFSYIQWRTQEFYSRSGGRGSTNSVEDRGQKERGSGGCIPPSQGFWRQLYFGTRNFISYSKIFLIFGILRLFMMTTNLFVIANVKQLRT